MRAEDERSITSSDQRLDSEHQTCSPEPKAR